MITMCDPPSGWKYGFPKAIPESYIKRMLTEKDGSWLRDWLLEEGYPESDIELALKHSRYWEEDVEDETN